MHILYGVPHSFYTSRVRCYLRNHNIDFIERTPAHPAFAESVLPQIRRAIIPVLQTADGQLIQDSVDIIEHFEAAGQSPSAWPQTPLQRVLAVLFEYYGCQVMLKHAMHYRWSFLAEQQDFLRHAFGAGSGSPVAQAEAIMARMQSYLPVLGINPQSIPLIEDSWLALLDRLEQLFAGQPYLFGGLPSIADYGLIGAMHAHLGRDPVPLGILQRRAPAVHRWIERMQAPGLDVPEYANAGGWVTDAELLPRLTPLLQQLADEIFPELDDKLAFLRDWISREQPADGQPVSAKPHQRQIGRIDTLFRGVPVTVGVEPYLLYLLQRAADQLAGLSEAERAALLQTLQGYGLARAVQLGMPLRVERRGHLEVWAEPR